jgi:aspartyl-tRNA(Asn)/glutamyl-tRNA(Gln) amidotransferase subunit A
VLARGRVAEQFQAFHGIVDLLVTPSLPTPPPVTTLYHTPSYDRWRDVAPYTLPFNLTGQPAASVPCGIIDAGLPVGLQIVGPRFADALVLRASRAREQALRRPQPHARLRANFAGLDA